MQMGEIEDRYAPTYDSVGTPPRLHATRLPCRLGRQFVVPMEQSSLLPDSRSLMDAIRLRTIIRSTSTFKSFILPFIRSFINVFFLCS